MIKSLFCEDISVEYEFKSVKFKGVIDRLKNEQDACTGVHSACRREENGHNPMAQSGYLCTTPSTAQAGADAGISWS